METNWARIWQDFRITIWFLIIAIATGLLFVLLQGAGTRMIATLWALAVMACGALTGFLFGIPRVLQTPDPVSIQGVKRKLALSANLFTECKSTQISSRSRTG